MNDESKKFREKYKADIDQNQQKTQDNNEYHRNKSQRFKRILSSEGNAKNDKKSVKKIKAKPSLKVATLILAAGIGIGALYAVGGFDKEPENSITQMQEMGIDTNEMGLQDDTAEMMEKYDEYFKKFDGKTAELTEQGVIDMVQEVKDINYNVIKDKMADLRGVDREDVKLYNSFDKGNGKQRVSVIINEGSYYDEERYDNDNYIFGIGKKNTIPPEISDLIIQIDDYEDIIKDVKADRITKVKAVKELKKLYAEISQVATKEFTMDNNGNITLQDYEKQSEKEIGD